MMILFSGAKTKNLGRDGHKKTFLDWSLLQNGSFYPYISDTIKGLYKSEAAFNSEVIAIFSFR